ncbi:PAS domain-containing sensor histidine kinase [Bacteroidota bacterium]
MVILIIQVYLLLNYINRFNREVANFFSALKTNDASYAFHDKAFPYISEKFRNDIESVRNQLFDITEQKQIQQSYLKTLIENSRTGIISVGQQGKIDIINRSALEILNIKSISNLKALNSIHAGLYHFISNTAFREEEKMIMIKRETKAIPLSVRISEFKQKKDTFKLITFQNIESELNEKELLSWHKLIRVLTHEINNSISPISSLANSLEKLFIKENATISTGDVTDKLIQKTSEGLQLISKRGEGLINFVNNYKSIASLKQMDFENIKVAELFYNLEILLKNELASNNIDVRIEILPIDLEINADKKYIEQIFINLVKNSIEAIETKDGVIRLKAFKNEVDKITLEIIDNGKGIPKDLIDQIFIPFFTTKENGSGIGLSLARQIIRLHGGNISVQSVPGLETKFTIVFN